MLLAGEAGIGEDPPDRRARRPPPTAAVLRGAASHDATPAYGPVVAALRSHLRANPGRARRLRAARRAPAACCCPSSAPPPDDVDRRPCARRSAARSSRSRRDRGALLVLDDLQWSDAATLELLTDLAPTLADTRLLILGAYRSDELAARASAAPRCATSCAGRGRSRRSRSARSTRPGPRRWSRRRWASAPSRPLAADDPRSLPGPAVLRRGARERARGGGPPAARQRGARARRGQRRRACPRPSATPCCCAAASSRRRARRPSEVAAVAGERFAPRARGRAGGRGGRRRADRARPHRTSAATAARPSATRSSATRSTATCRGFAAATLHRELAERLEARGGAAASRSRSHWLGAHDEERARGELLRAAG